MSSISSVHLDLTEYNSILNKISDEVIEVSEAMKGAHVKRELVKQCTRLKARAVYQTEKLSKLPEMTRKASGMLLVALKISQFISKVDEIGRLQRELVSKEVAKIVKNYNEMRPEIAKRVDSILFKDDTGFILHLQEEEPPLQSEADRTFPPEASSLSSNPMLPEPQQSPISSPPTVWPIPIRRTPLEMQTAPSCSPPMSVPPGLSPSPLTQFLNWGSFLGFHLASNIHVPTPIRVAPAPDELLESPTKRRKIQEQ